MTPMRSELAYMDTALMAQTLNERSEWAARRDYPYTADVMAEARERILELRRVRRAFAVMLVIWCATVWLGLSYANAIEDDCRAQPSVGASETKVVPLDPTEIRASRSAPVWL